MSYLFKNIAAAEQEFKPEGTRWKLKRIRDHIPEESC